MSDFIRPADWEPQPYSAYSHPNDPTKYYVDNITSDFVCPADWATRPYNAYPHPNDPTKYYVCGHQGAVLYSCPPGSVFDPNQHYCVPK